MERVDANGPFLHIFLYYMDTNYQLNRIVGTARGTTISWADSKVVQGAPALKDDTLLAVTNYQGEHNYIYYIPYQQEGFVAQKDTQDPSWFTPPKDI